ncbi:NADH-quinone oxidoreductase subunit N [Promicromonospora umidemergens]|uniref:NADH-quinone oxidoreductase subunit N n=1 Tax=Promicromonospora umidemergens TaxID=629679 RepID=A0ABP8X0W3_9MICO|nr:NADH-quinone oxidoreductase subunit NuoN [Promicromonospora umidemergens]MCP2286107.1 NADH-quinone oxidoreductase subunit N [Promicromonospora umidemergens]
MTEFVAPEIDWLALAPLIVVLGAGVVGVLIEAFVPEKVRRTTQIVLALAALAGAFAFIAVLWPQIVVQPVQVVGGSLTLTPFALGAQGIIAVLAFLGVLVVADRTTTGQDAFAPAASAVPGTPYEDLARRSGLEQTEIYPLLLFAVGGMMLFASTDDLIVMFIALEVLSLPLYVLCATARRRRLLSQEAAAKYFLLGAFASALFIFGVALIYGFAGTVRLLEIAQRVQQGLPLEGMSVLLVSGVLLVVVGLLFKVGAVPFHAWTPDVYTGAPTPITGFMAACTKVAAVAALVEVLYRISIGVGGVSPDIMRQLQIVIVVVAILTMVVGTVVGMVQTDVKRLLAYSSIAHAGFLLVGIAGFNAPVQSSTLFYLLAYGLATIGAFAVVTLVRERRITSGTGEDNGPVGEGEGVVLGEATEIAQWAGLGRKAPWLTAAFALFLLSMAGIPLTAGFIAKFGAFTGATTGGLWWLAVLGVLASVVAVAFYVRVLVVMVFQKAPDEPESTGTEAVEAGLSTGSTSEDAVPTSGGAVSAGAAATLTKVRVTSAQRIVVTVVRSRGPAAVAIAVCAIATVILGVFPSPVLGLVEQASKFVP